MKLNRLFLNGAARWMRGGEDYCVVDTVFPMVCGFIDRVTSNTRFAKMARAPVMYSSSMSRVWSDSWK